MELVSKGDYIQQAMAEGSTREAAISAWNAMIVAAKYHVPEAQPESGRDRGRFLDLGKFDEVYFGQHTRV